MSNLEVEWLKRAIQGDQDAFSNIVETYQKPVFNLCYRMLGNAQDAEDAAQETFLRAFKSIRRYDLNRAFSSWLLSIAAHYCIDQIRRSRVTVTPIEELPVPDIPDTSPGIESRLSLKEEQNRMNGLLANLDPIDKAAIVMFYWYDFSYDEICQALSISMSALKSRLHRARRALAVQWQERYPEKSVKERVLHESPTF